jgi:hypothetical protein
MAKFILRVVRFARIFLPSPHPLSPRERGVQIFSPLTRGGDWGEGEAYYPAAADTVVAGNSFAPGSPSHSAFKPKSFNNNRLVIRADS